MKKKYFCCFLTILIIFTLKNETETKRIHCLGKTETVLKSEEKKQEKHNIKRLIQKKAKYISIDHNNLVSFFKKKKKYICKVRENEVNRFLFICPSIKPYHYIRKNVRRGEKHYKNKRALLVKRELYDNWENCKKEAIDFIENVKRKTTNYIKIQKKKIENNNMLNFLWVCKNVLYKRGMLFLTFFVMINSAIISIIIPKFDNLLFNDLTNRKLDNFYPLLLQCMLARVVNMLLCSSRNYIFMMTSAHCIKIVKSILFEIYINKDHEYYDNIDFTSVVNKLTIEPHEFSDIIPYYLNPFIRNFFSIIFNFAYIFYLNKRLSTVILSCFIFSSFLSVIYSNLKKRRIKMVNLQKARNTKIALETLNNINIVKVYGTELHEYNKYKKSLNTILNLQKRKENFNLIHMIINKFFISVTYILIILNGNLLLKQGALDEKTFTSFFFYINNIYSYINMLDYYVDIVDMVDQYRPIVQMLKRYKWNKIKEKCQHGKKYQEKLKDHSAQSELSNAANLSESTIPMQIVSEKGGNEKSNDGVVLSFENVCFSYANNPQQNVLKNVNLKIYKNTNNLIIGKSGGGKSTLLKLILNLYKPSKGNIYLYKKPLNKYPSREIFDIITYVEQNSKLLNMTIRENLLYGVNKDYDIEESEEENIIDPTYSSNNNTAKSITNATNNSSGVDFDMIDLINISKCCTCHEFISRLTKRYETVVSSKTQLLTSSQVQKICVARALMRNPKILLLDESTSAVDKDNERQIFENIKQNSFFKDLTIIRITHKKANLDICDSIFTLKDGFLTKTR